MSESATIAIVRSEFTLTIKVSSEDPSKCSPSGDGCQFHAYYSDSDSTYCHLFNACMADSLGGAVTRCAACIAHFGLKA